MTGKSGHPVAADPTQLVEQVVFEEVIELNPQRLTVRELLRKVARDPGDCTETEAIAEALGNLKRRGVLRECCGVVEPTYAAVSTAALLAGR